ncbi:N-acetylmuramoyl-L-alanine amidase [Paenibacillus shirakamiensis]|uniref:N-acetylmuramoyl-L-alanine amidase n=1 Tax=Paenibacillus shirakamiensis TaxID=1265935 RepID=A0ABS4JG70_9BACL|nr:cell wall hydrolase [Paenibacillus shirakamiensis]MBP2000707.1 N-acetylmuramoyl-L-alanine amidase [Paenibacillus shirakamiensis]
MDIFKQNRYVALLIGAILVCVGSICLLWRTGQAEGEAKVYMPKLHAGTPILMQDSLSLKLDHASLVKSSANVVVPAQKQFVHTLPHSSQVELTHSEHAASQAIPVQALPVTPKIDKTIPPKQILFTRTALLSPEDQDQSTWKYALSDKELLLLQKIVMAEAEGEPYEGKVAVANVVLNRLRSANYPKTIREVVYQKYQFSPVRNGRLNRVTPNKDSVRAVTAALYGTKEVTDDTYYFLSIKLAKDLTIARTQHKTKQIGNHTFYK